MLPFFERIESRPTTMKGVDSFEICDIMIFVFGGLPPKMFLTLSKGLHSSMNCTVYPAGVKEFCPMATAALGMPSTVLS